MIEGFSFSTPISRKHLYLTRSLTKVLFDIVDCQKLYGIFKAAEELTRFRHFYVVSFLSLLIHFEEEVYLPKNNESRILLLLLLRWQLNQFEVTFPIIGVRPSPHFIMPNRKSRKCQNGWVMLIRILGHVLFSDHDLAIYFWGLFQVPIVSSLAKILSWCIYFLQKATRNASFTI